MRCFAAYMRIFTDVILAIICCDSYEKSQVSFHLYDFLRDNCDVIAYYDVAHFMTVILSPKYGKCRHYFAEPRHCPSLRGNYVNDLCYVSLLRK